MEFIASQKGRKIYIPEKGVSLSYLKIWRIPVLIAPANFNRLHNEGESEVQASNFNVQFEFFFPFKNAGFFFFFLLCTKIMHVHHKHFENVDTLKKSIS